MDLITVTPSKYSEGEYVTVYKDGILTTSLTFPKGWAATDVQHIKDRYFLLVFAVEDEFHMYILDMDGLERTMPPPTVTVDTTDTPSYLTVFSKGIQAVAAHGAEILYMDEKDTTHHLDLITGADTIVPNPDTDDIIFSGSVERLVYVRDGIPVLAVSGEELEEEVKSIWKGYSIEIKDKTLRISGMEYQLPFPAEKVLAYEGVGSYGSAVRAPDRLGIYSSERGLLILNLTSTTIKEAKRVSIPKGEELLSLNHAGILTSIGEHVIIRTPQGKELKYKARLATLGDFRLRVPVVQGEATITEELPLEGVTGWELDT